MSRNASLLAAAADGDDKGVKILVNSGEVDINTVDEEGNTPLHLAVKNNHPKITSYLLGHKAGVNKQNQYGETALLLAARSGNSKIVRSLLDYGAETRIEDNNGRTPFFVAMSAQHSEIAALLLPVDDVSTTTDGENLFGRTNTGLQDTNRAIERNRIEAAKRKDEQALRDAAEAGDIVGVKEILKLFPDIDLDATDDLGHTALYRATFYGRMQVVEFLLNEGADPDLDDADGQTSLHVAAERGFGNIMRVLLEKTKNVNTRNFIGNTPMYSAATNGNISVLRELLDFDADPNIPNNNEETPLWAAASFGQEAFVKLLLEYSNEQLIQLDMDSRDALNGLAPLHLAAERGDVAIARLLLEFGASKDIRATGGNTPLFIAADKGRTRTVSLLLDHTASLNAVNAKGETALYVSSLNGQVPVTKKLLAGGADTEAADKNGQNPLMGASQEGHTAIILQLLKAGAEIEATNNEGESPVMIASSKGFQNAVALLIDNGADITAARNDGRTSVHLAAVDGHLGVLNVLLSAVLEQNRKSRQTQISRSSPLHLATDTQGETALHLATRFRQVSVMKLLLDFDSYFQKQHKELTIYGQLADVQNRFGWSALHSAVDRAHHGAVDLLLENGADVNAADIFGNTPIHLASRGVDYSILYLLLKEDGVRINALNVEGRTPLHFASACVRPHAVTYLLNAGSDSQLRDVYKKPAKDVVGSSEVCNPGKVVTRGLCSMEKQRPDMCPLMIGNQTEKIETKNLLLRAEKTRNQTRPCLVPCERRFEPNASHDSNSQDTVTSTRDGSDTAHQKNVDFPIFGVIFPVIAIVLLIMFAIYLCQRKKQIHRTRSTPRRLSDIISKWEEEKKIQNDDLPHLGSTQEIGSSNHHLSLAVNHGAKNAFSGVRRFFGHVPSLSDSSDASDSSSDSGSCCGWSDVSEDEVEVEGRKVINSTQCSSRDRSLNCDGPKMKVPPLRRHGNDRISEELGIEQIELSPNEISLRNLNQGLPLYRMGSVPRAKTRESVVHTKDSFCIRIADDDHEIHHESESFTFPKPVPDRSASTPMF